MLAVLFHEALWKQAAESLVNLRSWSVVPRHEASYGSGQDDTSVTVIA